MKSEHTIIVITVDNGGQAGLCKLRGYLRLASATSRGFLPFSLHHRNRQSFSTVWHETFRSSEKCLITLSAVLERDKEETNRTSVVYSFNQ